MNSSLESNATHARALPSNSLGTKGTSRPGEEVKWCKGMRLPTATQQELQLKQQFRWQVTRASNNFPKTEEALHCQKSCKMSVTHHAPMSQPRGFGTEAMMEPLSRIVCCKQILATHNLGRALNIYELEKCLPFSCQICAPTLGNDRWSCPPLILERGLWWYCPNICTTIFHSKLLAYKLLQLNPWTWCILCKL